VAIAATLAILVTCGSSAGYRAGADGYPKANLTGLSAGVIPRRQTVRIGGALFLIAVGAILKWAVRNDHLSGINTHVVGLILLIIGIVALLFELGLVMSRRRRTTVVEHRPGVTYLDPYDPVDRY
jgi:hypothetical protein